MVFEDGTRRLRFHVRPLRVPTSDDGLFSEDSVIRRVYSDSVCGLGAGTALLLQLANPSIAQGVHDHSNYEDRPLDRLFGTLYAMNAVVFGSRNDAAQMGDAVGRAHANVNGPGYSAFEPELLCWVNATLLGTALQLYQRIIRPLPVGDLDEFVRDSARVGEVFGCPIDAQPSNWREFDDYWHRTVDELKVTDNARRVAHSLLSGRGLPARPMWLPALALARALTAATLPPRLRVDYRLPWRSIDQTLERVVFRTASSVLPRIPDRWRQVGPELLRSA